MAWVDRKGGAACAVPPCPVHVATDTDAIDQSILISVQQYAKDNALGFGLAGRAGHLPRGTIRHPQAVALSFIRSSMGDGTEGRGPSLHMDASASILRPLSPYGPDKRGLPSFPRLSALRCCGSSGEQGNIVPRDRGTGGLAALPAVGTTTAASESGAG